MIPGNVSITLAAANAALIIASNTPAGAGNLTLVSPTSVTTTQPNAVGQPSPITTYTLQPTSGVGASTAVTTSSVVLDAPRRVLVTYGNEASNRTVTIYGTNRYGAFINETVTVVSGAGGTVYTQQDFKSVTQVSVFAAWTTNMSVGTNAVGSSQWFVVQWQVTPFNLGLTYTVTGTQTAQIEITTDDPNNLPSGVIAPVPTTATGLGTLNTTTYGSITTPITAWRVTVTAGTGTGRVSSIQAGLRQG